MRNGCEDDYLIKPLFHIFPMPSKKLFLLDAMALIYRAHFAFSKNPRINSKGLNTGAVLGFTNTLLEVLKKEDPTHIGVAFDTKVPTFRHEAYEPYKANREAQPEDIAIAIPYIKKLLQAFHIPILEKDRYEADDVIGTLAKKAGRADFEVYMMTPDKDYAQLVEEHIFLYKPAFMGNAVQVLGVEEVLEKWRIERVDQVVDILGLQGDSVDNIPGIPGVGAKTAVKLLAQYGTVEGILENSDKLKGKMKEKVQANADQARMSKDLARIEIEVPIEFNEEDLLRKDFDKEAVKELFSELEFKTLSRKLLGEPAPKKPTKKKAANTGQTSLFGEATPASVEEPVEEEASEVLTLANNEHRYHLVDDPKRQEELAYFLSLQDEFCFDTETDSLKAFDAGLVGIAFSYVKGEAYYVPVPANKDEAQQIIDRFKEVLENKEIVKVGQNIKYDCLVLAKYGIQVAGVFFDTMVAHYLLEPDKRHKMDYLAEAYLNYRPMPIEDLIGKKGKKQGSMREVPVEKVVEYACEDADITLQLKGIFEPKLKEANLIKLFEEVDAPLVRTLALVEANGVQVDKEVLEAYSKELLDKLVQLQDDIYREAGEEFTINSPKQLGVILFDKLKLSDKPKKTKTGQYATNEEVLVGLADKHRIVRMVLDYRQVQKLKSTYVDALPALVSELDGMIHTSYNQTVTATGRLSSTDPNLQNIPIRTDQGREIRKAFTARGEDYVIVAADYSQIELRIMAAFSKDEHMIDAFKNKRDIHTSTASRIFKVPMEEVDSDMRRKAKTANFGIIYGISAFGLSQRLNIPRGEASEIINAYFEEFPAVKEYMDQMIETAREQEYVETLLGRRRYLRDINSRNHTIRGFAERNAINTPIQGSAADLIKIAMIRVQDWMDSENLKSKMIMQVHDELVFDAHKDELDLLKGKVMEIMQGAMTLEVPLEVEIGVGDNWLEAH